MTEFGQVIEKLTTLEKQHDKMMNALVGNDELGQKGFIHRLSDIERETGANTMEIQAIKTIKAYSEKKSGRDSNNNLTCFIHRF
jgi:hypothetical protein